MNKWVKWGLVSLGVVLYFVGAYFSHNYFYDKGIKEGIKAYHTQCYEVGGFSIDGDDGKVIACSRMGQLPPEELKMFNEDQKKRF